MLKVHIILGALFIASSSASSFAKEATSAPTKATIEEHLLKEAHQQARAIILEKYAKTPTLREQVANKIKDFPFFPVEKRITDFPKPIKETETDPTLLAGYFSEIAKAYQKQAALHGEDNVKDYTLKADYYQGLAEALDPPVAVQAEDEELQ